MVRILIRLSDWKIILALFILFTIFLFVIFPRHQELMTEAAGAEVMPLDTRFTYTRQDVVRDFDQLGPQGREIYKALVTQVDMLFPIVYGLFFILTLAFVLKNFTRYPSRWILLALLPLAGVIFDYLENFNILRLLLEHPNYAAETVAYGERMTQLKHGFLLLSVAMIVLVALVLIARRVTSPSRAVS